MTKPIAHFTSLLDRAALEHLQRKILLPSFSHYDVWLYEHAVGFTVAKMMDADLLADVKAALEQAVESGEPYQTFAKKLKPYLMAKGWWGEQIMTDPANGIAKTVQLGSTRRLRVIYQTNLATAFAAGQWARIQEDKQAFPYLKYIASTAEQKRQSHMAFYGKIWRADDPIWNSIFPPNGYGCQCTVRQLTQKQALRERGEDIAAHPDRYTERQKADHSKGIINDDTADIQWREFVNPRTGQKVNVPFDVTPAFAHNHAKRLEQIADLAVQRHGKATADQMEALLSDYIHNKVVRPNFENLDFKPNLKVSGSDLDLSQAQIMIYAHAGTGSQLGAVPVGQIGSFEWFRYGERYYLLEYSGKGTSVYQIRKSELSQIKHKEIMLILNRYASPVELEKLPELLPKFEAADYGEADMADKLAAFLYSTNGGYKAVNPPLIQAKRQLALLPTNQIIQAVRLIDDFLAVAPKYQGTTTRKLSKYGIPDVSAFLNAHRKGNVVRYSNFSSTSKPDGQFGNDHSDIVLTIHGKSGVDISRLSYYAGEGEVLMPRHAVYRVLNQYEQNGMVHIELEELTEKHYTGRVIVQLSALGDKL